MTSIANRALALVLVLVALAGCAEQRLPTATTADVRVVLSTTGGFAGVSETITVEPDGGWTRADRGGTRRTGRLTAGQRTRLRELTADPRLATEAARTPAATRCRDALNHTLTVGSRQVSFTDCPTDPGQPEVAPAIAALLDEATR